MTDTLLVKKALASSTPKRQKFYSEAEVELAIAWADGRVTMAQVGRATGFSGSTVLTFLAYRLRQAWQERHIVPPLIRTSHQGDVK